MQAKRAREKSKQAAMTKQLRIAYAIQNVGGIDFSHDLGDTVPVKYTLKGLQHAGHRVVCLQLNGRSVKCMADISHPERVQHMTVGISGKKLFRLGESGVRRLQRTFRLPYWALFDTFRFYEACFHSLPEFDLCHEHNGLFCTGAAVAARRLGLPYVLTFSADPLLELELVGKPLKGAQAAMARTAARFTYETADKIICVSEAAKRHLFNQWRVPADKIVVMPNGVDVNLFSQQVDPCRVRAHYGLGDDPVVTFVGSFQQWHGLELLVESFARVLQKVPRAKLFLVGDGPARSALERQVAALGIEAAVCITGLVPQSQVPQMLAAADIAVIPYPQLPRELWFSPLKLYEYMAAGKAIVASKAGQIAEVIQDEQTGILVEPGDVDELTEALADLLGNETKRNRLGQRAREQAVRHHSWRQYIERLERIYQDVL